MIGATALQLSLPLLPVMRGDFSSQGNSVLCLGILDVFETGFHCSVNRGTEITQALKNPQCLFVGRLAWLSQCLHCSSGTLHGPLARARTQVLFLETGFNSVLCSDKFGFSISYGNRKVKYKIRVMIQV